MGTNQPDGGYSAETKAWVEMWGRSFPVARTNDRQFCLVEPMAILPGNQATLVVSVDGVEHRRRIRITGAVAWEYEEIEE